MRCLPLTLLNKLMPSVKRHIVTECEVQTKPDNLDNDQLLGVDSTNNNFFWHLQPLFFCFRSQQILPPRRFLRRIKKITVTILHKRDLDWMKRITNQNRSGLSDVNNLVEQAMLTGTYYSFEKLTLIILL